MNTNEAYSPTRTRKRRRKTEKGVGLGVTLLGAACAVGVFALLALLYHVG
jgi:hypothetical protein